MNMKTILKKSGFTIPNSVQDQSSTLKASYTIRPIQKHSKIINHLILHLRDPRYFTQILLNTS